MVSNFNQNEIENVSVTVAPATGTNSTNIGIATNSDGQFYLFFNYKLPYKLVFNHVAYYKTEITIEEREAPDLEIELVPRVIESDEVVVTSDIVSIEELENPVTVDRVQLLDLNTFMQDAEDGAKTVDGVSFSVGIEQNSIISADGFYRKQRGHALLSNQLLPLFNTSCGSNFKRFDVNKFPSNEYQLDSSWSALLTSQSRYNSMCCTWLGWACSGTAGNLKLFRFFQIVFTGCPFRDNLKMNNISAELLFLVPQTDRTASVLPVWVVQPGWSCPPVA